jgi:hypothetical protein
MAYNKTSWAILFGGQKVVVVFCVRGEEARPVLFIANPVELNNRNTPILALLTYMLLTSSEDNEALASILSIGTDTLHTVIEDDYLTPSDDSPTSNPTPPSNTRNTRSKGHHVDQVAFACLNTWQMPNPSLQASIITTSVRDYESPILRFVRIIPSITPGDKSHTVHIGLLHRLYAGAVGFVMQASTADTMLAIKFAQAQEKKTLVLEASVYGILMGTSDPPPVPVFYGLFEGPVWYALVMSFEGDMVEDFKVLPLACRSVSPTVPYSPSLP